MSVIVGIAGAARNAAAAIWSGEGIVAVCEQERLTRTRGAALKSGQLPVEAVDTVLGLAGHAARDVSAYAVGEVEVRLPSALTVQRVDHHYAHAATSFYTASFARAIILVCDRHSTPELTVWRGDEHGISPLDFPWTGPGFATIYSRATAALGFAPEGDEHRFEALARGVAATESDRSVHDGDRLDAPPDLDASLARLLASVTSDASLARAAERIQRHLGEVLLQVLAGIRARFGGQHLCLAGGLFFNSYFTTVVAQSGIYPQTFVPTNPGNAGVAVGAALGVAARGQALASPVALSPFLGPEYGTNDIKQTLDNCKLAYDYVTAGEAIARTAEVLAQGKLVGWFQGRMEWGPRALGNRSILASPIAPYVLENLNLFLKHREPHRSYGVSVCSEDLSTYFSGPPASDFMEYEYDVIQRDALAALLPGDTTKLRVQTVPKSAGNFHTLIKSFGQLTGVPILVNTSFNGFQEPIVCTPRDAVRVFYGTGLDMAVIGGFILQK